MAGNDQKPETSWKAVTGSRQEMAWTRVAGVEVATGE